MSFEVPIKLMREGLGSVSYGSPPSAASPAGIFSGANNGSSRSTINPNLVVWGQDVGQVGNPGQLISNREIPFNKFSMTFDGLGADINPLPGLNNIFWTKKIRNTGGVYNSTALVVGDTDTPVWANYDPVATLYQNPDLLISKSPGSDFDNPTFLEMSASTGTLNGFLFGNLGSNFGEYFPEMRTASNGRAGSARAFNLEMYARDSNPGTPQWQVSWNDYDLPGHHMANSDFLAWLNGTDGADPLNRVFLFVNKNYNFMVGPSAGVPVSNGAILQVLGDMTTADPGTGVGKWKIGQFHAGVVVPDAANYVEVNIDGVVRKLIVAA